MCTTHAWDDWHDEDLSRYNNAKMDYKWLGGTSCYDVEAAVDRVQQMGHCVVDAAHLTHMWRHGAVSSLIFSKHIEHCSPFELPLLANTWKMYSFLDEYRVTVVSKYVRIFNTAQKSTSHYAPQPYTNQSVWKSQKFKSLLNCTSEMSLSHNVPVQRDSPASK